MAGPSAVRNTQEIKFVFSTRGRERPHQEARLVLSPTSSQEKGQQAEKPARAWPREPKHQVQTGNPTGGGEGSRGRISYRLHCAGPPEEDALRSLTA